MISTFVRDFRRRAGAAVLLLLAPTCLAAQERVREPLPLEVAVDVRSHNGRSPIHFSPDGEWLAHTIATDETIPLDTVGYSYAATGFPFSEGDARMEAVLTHTKTGEVIRLGGARSSNWGAVWSPDGKRVAFYSDEGGEAGVWVWERATRTAKRFPGVVARPRFGFERPRWSPDGERILVKVLPEGRTIAEANALGMTVGAGRHFPEAGPSEPSVIVKRAGASAAPASAEAPAAEPDYLRMYYADLAVLELRTQRVTRLVQDQPVRYYAFSPDGKQVAYAVMKESRPGYGAPWFDLIVMDAAGGAPRRLARDVGLGYGIEWSWSPDGKMIAFTESDPEAEDGIHLVAMEDGTSRLVKIEGAPDFGSGHYGEGEYAPMWDAAGRYIYVTGGGELWRIDPVRGIGEALARIPGWKIHSPVQPFERSTIWTSDGGRTAWVMARSEAGGRSGLFAVDLKSGRVMKGIEEVKSYSGIYNLAGSEVTGEIAFVSNDQQHLDDVWLFDTKGRRARQLTHLNSGMERYALGEARVIEWTGPEGKTLRGALLLPPGYKPGQRLPTVIWVYGGAMGSEDVTRFGLGGFMPMFNMHVLATRGYAVLSPDVPVRTGRTMKDIYEAAISAADAVVAQGYADPERLAVMGHSYGTYSVLSVVTQTPRFKAAIISAGSMHPHLAAAHVNGMLGYVESGQGNMGGTPWEHPDRYRDNSTLFLFDRITTPILLGYGEKDGTTITPDAVFTALERLGKPIEYRLYEGEGHVFSRPESVIDFWKRRLDFLAEHLGLKPDASGRVAGL